MNFLKQLFHKPDTQDPLVEYWAAVKADPHYISAERYAEIWKEIEKEPLALDLITPSDANRLLRALFGNGYIPVFGGGWRDAIGESYIRLKSGSTPTINESRDPYEFARKQRALNVMRHKLTELYAQGVVQGILYEAKEAIRKDIEAAL